MNPKFSVINIEPQTQWIVSQRFGFNSTCKRRYHQGG